MTAELAEMAEMAATAGSWHLRRQKRQRSETAAAETWPANGVSWTFAFAASTRSLAWRKAGWRQRKASAWLHLEALALSMKIYLPAENIIENVIGIDGWYKYSILLSEMQ
jgi:hypothetical protein